MIALRRSTVLADVHARTHGQEHQEPQRPARRLHIVPALIHVGADMTTPPAPPANDAEVYVGADTETDLADAVTVDDVDRVFRKHLRNGDVPDSIAKDYWVSKTIHENGHTLEILVAPDYWAAGTDDNPMRAGKTSQFFAQDVADEYDSILPSAKLLRFIEANADVKIPYIAVQKSGMADDSTQAVITANDKANAAFEKRGLSATDGNLKIGYFKSYITMPNLDGTHIAIAGGRLSESGGIVQPPSTIHTTGVTPGTPNYSDNSHKITLVSRKAKLDGKSVDLRIDVFGSDDPKIWGMVADKRHDPVFPNSGSSSLAQFSVPGASDIGSGGPLLGGAQSRPAAYVKDAGANMKIATVLVAMLGVGLLVWKFAA